MTARGIALVGALAAFSVLNGFEASKVNVALPAIARGLGATAAEQQLIVLGYALAIALVLVPAGRAGDRGHRRALALLAVGVYLVASLLAALAPDAAVLLVARVLQGLAGGIMLPQVFGLIQAVLAPSSRPRALASFGTLMSVSVGAGPIFGGAVLEAVGGVDGWRMLWFVNVPVLLVVLGALLWALPTNRGSVPSLRGPRMTELLRIPALRIGMLYGALFFGGVSTLLVILPVHLLGPLVAGALAGCWALASGPGAAVTARIPARRYRLWLVLSAAVCALATGAVALCLLALDPAAQLVPVAVAMLVGGIAGGVCFSLNQIAALRAVPEDAGGSAGALLQLAPRVGTCIANAAILAVFFATTSGFALAMLLIVVLFAGGALVALLPAHPRREASRPAVPAAAPTRNPV